MLAKRKKRKLADAIFKMSIGTPEYEEEKKHRIIIKLKREERREKTKSFLKICSICLSIFFVAVLACSILICPLIFYTNTEITFNVSNISSVQYAYILNGNSSMYIKYIAETRSLNDNQTTFHMCVSHCWNHTEKAEIWAAQGGIPYLKGEEK
jgi:hypothetical protein